MCLTHNLCICTALHEIKRKMFRRSLFCCCRHWHFVCANTQIIKTNERRGRYRTKGGRKRAKNTYRFEMEEEKKNAQNRINDKQRSSRSSSSSNNNSSTQRKIESSAYLHNWNSHFTQIGWYVFLSLCVLFSLLFVFLLDKHINESQNFCVYAFQFFIVTRYYFSLPVRNGFSLYISSKSNINRSTDESLIELIYNW